MTPCPVLGCQPCRSPTVLEKQRECDPDEQNFNVRTKWLYFEPWQCREHCDFLRRRWGLLKRGMMQLETLGNECQEKGEI